jgi:hypothetical protein
MSERLFGQTPFETTSRAEARLWFAEQPDQVKKVVEAIVADAIQLCVFDFAVMLDGDTSYVAVNGSRGEVKLELLIYDSDNSLVAKRPDRVVEIAPPNDGYPLHDLLIDLMDAI